MAPSSPSSLLLAFAVTNVDGLLCMAAAFAVDPPRRRLEAIGAAALGFAVLLCLSLAAAAAIGRVAGAASWFGVVPAGVGIVRLWRIVTARSDGANWISSGASLVALTLATGGDNVAVYTPLFALTPYALAWSGAFLALWTTACAALTFATPDLRRVHLVQRYADPTVAASFVAFGFYLVIAR
ncbi:MAG: hypothetical protein JOY59_00100 [Candidatus Eremiobacteraeota bacterium]|nr:hypothetical protein [Candidatus Eremiobacteraeota bacterium]